MTKEEAADAFGKVLSKHTNKSIARCMAANADNNDKIIACLTRENDRLREIYTICSGTKFNVPNDAMLLEAVDRCIEVKINLR
jgi:hypothetical protein